MTENTILLLNCIQSFQCLILIQTPHSALWLYWTSASQEKCTIFSLSSKFPDSVANQTAKCAQYKEQKLNTNMRKKENVKLNEWKRNETKRKKLPTCAV